MGFRVQDKYVTFYPLFGYIPKFHLKYRVFLNKMSGFTKERTPSFVVSLDGVKSVELMVEEGMKGIEAPNKKKQ